MSKLAESIKSYRKKNGLSQSEFASKLYVTKQAVSKWETGRGNPDSALIPEIAKVMDISIDELMGVKRVNKKVIVLITSLIIITVLTIVFVPMVSSRLEERRAFNDFLEQTELASNIQLPDQGTLVNADFNGWSQYGNVISVDRMSYIVFDEMSQTEAFEVELESSHKWTASLDSQMIDSIPVNIQSYATIGDFYSIYNIESNTYNELPILPGDYDCIFMIYQLDTHRLVVFEYSMEVEEGE